ncbi:MAG: DUF2085 domain-containing protein [Methanomassiliicoccales archaeon]
MRLKILSANLFAVWLILVFISPLLVASSAVNDLNGKVGELDNQNVIEEMNLVPRTIYTMGDIYCHQKSERSYFVNGNQMPFCSRDVGIFIGLFLGMIASLLMPGFKITLPLFLLLFLPLAIDGSLQLLTNYESINILRVVTGIFAGTAVSFLISMLLDELLEKQRKRE